MTIASAVAKSGPYNGNGFQTVFGYNFKVFSASELQVVLRSAGGIETDQTLATHYTVSGVGNDAGGNVTMIAAPPAGATLTIVRNVPFVQLTDLRNQGGFYPEVHERVFDRLTQQTQQLRDSINRALQVAVSTPEGIETTLPSPVPEKLIGWNPAGTGLQNFDASVLATLVAYGTARADLFDGDGATTQFTLTSNPGNQAVLDVSISGVTQRPGVDYTWAGGTTLTFVVAPPVGVNNILARYFQGLPGIITEANDVTYKNPTTALTVIRSVQSVLQEGLSIGDFDSSPNLNNGVYDATLAMQRLAAECAANGFVGKLPAGKFSISGQVLFDEQSTAVVSDRRGSLRGAGIAQTEIKAQSNGSYAAINFLGSATSGGIGLGIKPGGFLLSGPETDVGTGMEFNQYAFWSMDEIFVRGFDIGLNMKDCLSVQLANLFIRNNRRGLVSAYENFSRPNAWSLANVDFGLNKEFAASISEAALFSFDGGAVQGNGIGGTGLFGYRGGIFMTNAGTEGTVGGNFRNVYFEHNAGDSDITFSANAQTAVHNFYGCNFMRLSNADFVTNSIKVDVVGSAFNIINIDGCGFEHAGSYTPSAARPYVNVAAISGAVNDMANNYYQSDTEYVDLIKHGLGTRSGYVPASGTGATLPRGWSVIKTATGTYQVTHDLNLAIGNYRASAVSVDGNPYLVQRVFKSANSITVITTTVAGVAVDCAFDFTVFR